MKLGAKKNCHILGMLPKDECSQATANTIQINPIPVEVEVFEESDPCTDSGGEGRQKFEDVEREYRDEVRAAESNLQSILKIIYTPDLDMTPWEHFAMKQSCLAGVGMLSRIRLKKLTFSDVRDHMENLACLVDLIGQFSFRSSGYGAYLLANIAQAMGKLAELLEDFSLKRVTDWRKVTNHYLDIYKEALSQPKLSEVFPPLALFTDVRLIARGRFTTVHCAQFAGTEVGIKAAYKKKRPINRKRSSHNRKFILNSGQTGCMLKHPLFSRLYATFSTDEAYLSVMEYHRGVDVDKVIANVKTFPTTFAMLIVAQLCVALEYLHYVGFIHRNLRVCSGIFSVRFLPGFRRRTSSEFSDHEVEGDLNFQAPELVKKAAYGRAIDWWSLGVTAFIIRFGRLPFRAASENELKTRILKTDPEFDLDPRDRQLPGYSAFVQTLLKKHPKTRMCSRGYDQYRKHDLFKSLSWKNVETRNEFIEFPPITRMLGPAGAPTYAVAEDYFKDPTIITRVTDMKDTPVQSPLYVFCSEPMRKVLSTLENSRPRGKLEAVADEFLVPFEDGPYKFKDIFKSTRM